MTGTSIGTTDYCQMFKYFYSISLLIFCTATIIGLLFTSQAELARDVNPALAFFVLLISVAWLTMVEGSQGAIVGLGSVDAELYKDSHPLAYKCTSIAHKNLDRYLLGRQFMVIFIIFTVEMAGSPIQDVDLWGLPDWVISMFLSSGLALILIICMVGQLNSEINGCHCMLDYIDNFFAVFTIWIAMAIEFSGLLHICYLIQKIVAKVSGNAIESDQEPRSAVMTTFFYGRCLISVVVLCFAFFVTLKALFAGNTTVWEPVAPAASVAIFFALLIIMGLLEASQISYFAVTRLPVAERGDNWFSRASCKLLFANNNQNLAAFMIGRQLCVVACVFFIARTTAVSLPEDELSLDIQSLFKSGLLGALIVTVAGSIAWRLLASAFPLVFLANPVAYILLRFCLLVEMTGVLHGAWVLAAIHKKIAGFESDEVYIGTEEDRNEIAEEGSVKEEADMSIQSKTRHVGEINESLDKEAHC